MAACEELQISFQNITSNLKSAGLSFQFLQVFFLSLFIGYK